VAAAATREALSSSLQGNIQDLFTMLNFQVRSTMALGGGRQQQHSTSSSIPAVACQQQHSSPSHSGSAAWLAPPAAGHIVCQRV
jgi:hypothetical protein